ncbi:MAG: DEAD/DEAH box helicase [Nanoarchaeota archaeon]
MKFLQNITPRKYQEEIFKTCKEKNCLVVLPTGLGKTLIALMLAIERIEKFPGQKVLFLAPTKPLAEQHLKSFKKYLPELFGSLELFTGNIKSQQRQKIWDSADIIFSTPQCIANDLKKNLYTLEEVCLLIEDESHRCVKNYDYALIAKKYLTQSPRENQRILGLTASPGNDKKTISTICKNLDIKEVELRTRKSEDVSEYLQERKFSKINVELPAEMQEMRHVLKELHDKYIQELKSRRVLYAAPTKVNLINLQKKMFATISRGNKNFNYLAALSACAQAIKLQHAIELLETQTLKGFQSYLQNLFEQASKKKSKGVSKLVAKQEFNYLFMSANELLAKQKEHPKINKSIEIIKKEIENNQNAKIIIFTQFRETAAVLSKNLNKFPKINAGVFVGQTKKSSGKDKASGLSQKEQKEMIQKFSDNDLNVLCATCIAEEGLDIPEVSAVIFYEPIPSAIRSIQRSGRTARLSKGKLIILITKNTRDETFYYVSRAKEKKMHSAIDSIKQDLNSGKKINNSEQQKTLA